MSRVNWYALSFGLLAVAGAAMAFEPAFSGTRWVIAVLVALFASGSVMAWTIATRTGAIQAIFISALAALFTTIATVLSGSLGQGISGTISDFFSGLTGGWNDSLQEDLPLIEPTMPLVWATMMIWITAAIVSRALGAGRASLPVFLAPMILLSMATAITVPAGPPSRLPVAVVAVGLLGVLATTSAREVDRSWGQVRSSALVVLIATAAGLFVMTIPSNDVEGAFDPRTFRSDNTTDVDVPDLLAQLSELTGADPSRALTLSVIDGVRPDRLRLAVYDEYDGERWKTTTSFRQILQFTPPEVAPAGTPSTVQVQVSGVPGPWLPLLDRVTNIRPTVRGWDEESGTALRSSLTSTVQGSVVTSAELADATAVDAEIDSKFIALPASTPAIILDLAAETTAESPDARTAVTDLRNAVLELGRDDSVPAGHSLGRLTFDLDGRTPMAPEQLVALHATMVRAVGIPARIVVGYAIGDDDEVSSTALTAWTEAAFTGVGWVAFNPVPTEQFVVDGEAGDVPASTTSLPGQAVTEAQVVPRELSPSARSPETQPSGDSSIGWAQVGVTAIVLLVLLFVLVVIARMMRRRSRRRATSAPWSIAGAWGELLDRLRENSAPAPANRTVEEATDQVEDIAPRAAYPLRSFSKLVNVTLYSDAPPSWDDAEDAWDLLKEIEDHLREARGRSVTVKARIDPRSLRYPTPRPAPNRARRPHPPRFPRTDHPRVQR